MKYRDDDIRKYLNEAFNVDFIRGEKNKLFVFNKSFNRGAPIVYETFSQSFMDDLLGVFYNEIEEMMNWKKPSRLSPPAVQLLNTAGKVVETQFYKLSITPHGYRWVLKNGITEIAEFTKDGHKVFANNYDCVILNYSSPSVPLNVVVPGIDEMIRFEYNKSL